MKRYIRNSENFDPATIQINKIISIVLVGDLYEENPRDYAVYGSNGKTGKLDYSTMTREELLQLPRKEFERIHDVRILRKMNREDLTIQQQRDVIQDGSRNFKSSVSQVKEVLTKLRNCPSLYVWRTTKNNEFTQEIWNLGGRLRDDDVENIVRDLTVRDYSYSTYSYIESTWNELLMVFEYRKPYTFRAKDKESSPVIVEAMDVYIKIDVDSETGDGYAVMSFHRPENKMTHPYKDYPEDKE